MGDMQRSIRFPDGLDARIAKIAEAEDRAFSYVVVRELEKALGGSSVRPASSQVPVSEEAPVAASGERIPSRPTPPRGQPSKRPDTSLRTAHTLPKVERKAKATDALSTALKRQQALNKGKGI